MCHASEKKKVRYSTKIKKKQLIANLCTEMFRTSGIVLYRTNLLRKCTMYSQSRLANLPVSEAGDTPN